MSAQRLRAVVAGSGERLLGRHLPQLLDPVNRTEIVGIFDPRRQAADHAAARCRAEGHDTAVVSSFEELCSLEADAALVASPNASHFEQAMVFLERRVHVLVEKPPTTSRSQALVLAEAAEAAQRAGTTVVCSFQGALSPERAAARDLVADGGGVRALHGFVRADWLSSHCGTWRTDREISGGGFLFDSGVHLLQAAVDLGGPVRFVTARLREHGDIEIDGAAILEFESGAIGSLAWCGDVGVRAPTGDIEVMCARRLVRTGIWGHWLEVDAPDNSGPVVAADDTGPWSHLVSYIDAGEAPRFATPAMWLDVVNLFEAIVVSHAEGRTVAVSDGAREEVQTGR